MIESLKKLLIEYGFSPQSILTKDNFGRFHGVVLNTKGEKFFLKAAASSLNYGYKSMLAEANVTSFLSKHTHNQKIVHKGYRLLLPRVEKVIITSRYVCIMSEYINADKLLDSSAKEIAQKLITTVELVKVLGANINKDSSKLPLKKYTKSYLLLAAPLRFLKATLLSPKLFFNLFINALTVSKVFRYKDTYSLVHADINASNIMLDKKTIYLTDWEEAGWGISEYNYIAPIIIQGSDKNILSELTKNINTKNDTFKALLAYRLLVMFNQKIETTDSRRIRDTQLLADLYSSNLKI